MRSPSPVLLAVVAVLLVATWVVLGLVRPATRPDAATAHAVDTLVRRSGADALAAVPADFAAERGYTPVVREGLLVRPDGDCSSPLPLPASFDRACEQHDLGYDLLRHATAVGGTLAVGARADIDDQFLRTARASCRAQHEWPRPGCEAAASLAGMALSLNTIRQHGSTPGHEGVGSVAEGSVAGGAVVAGAWGLAGSLLRVRSRLARTDRRVGRRAWAAVPAPRPVPVVVALGATAVSLMPSFVPRSALVQGVLTALFVGTALVVTRRHHDRGALGVGHRRATLLGAAAVVLPLLAVVQHVEAPARAAMGLAPAGPTHWLLAASVVAVLVGLRALARLAWTHRRRAARAGLAVTAAAALALQVSPAMAAPGAEAPLLEQSSPVGAVRAYASLGDGDTARARARVAVDRLEARGGLQRSRVVMAMPTGSGWVDPEAVTGFERRFGDDVALVSVQYAAVPSWVAYLVRRSEAREAALALFDELTTRIAALPADQRPDLHLYGESLGALAAQSVLAEGGAAARDRVCSSLWVGPPGGEGVGAGREAVVANDTDPVAHVSPWLLVRPDGDRAWLPVTSFVLTAGDLADSLAPTAGWGHRYGPDQVDAMATC